MNKRELLEDGTILLARCNIDISNLDLHNLYLEIDELAGSTTSDLTIATRQAMFTWLFRYDDRMKG